MSFVCAFRAQLVVQGQRDLYDYWCQCAGERIMPARPDFDPLKVPHLLPYIGLIDVRNGLDQGSFTLAGTRLRDIYGAEITGRRLSELFFGDCAAYWRRVYARITKAASPGTGVIRGPSKGREHVVLFWLRLPLSDDGSRVDRILCFDIAGPFETHETDAP